MKTEKYMQNNAQNTENNNANNIKQQQLDIINKNNPMTDSYHQGIRTVETEICP